MNIDVELTPAEGYPFAAKRCVMEFRKMKTNAELSDANPTGTWQHLF